MGWNVSGGLGSKKFVTAYDSSQPFLEGKLE